MAETPPHDREDFSDHERLTTLWSYRVFANRQVFAIMQGTHSRHFRHAGSAPLELTELRVVSSFLPPSADHPRCVRRQRQQAARRHVNIRGKSRKNARCRSHGSCWGRGSRHPGSGSGNLDRPGKFGGTFLPTGLTYQVIPARVVFFLEFLGRHVTAGRMKSFPVVPGYPFQGCEHHVRCPGPRPPALDKLLLVKAI